MSSKGKFYMTTAIAYTSGKPHIGNTYEIVLADAIARFRRQEGYDVYFQTGTDEHGQKIQEKAKSAALQTLNNLIDNVAGNMMTSLGNTELLSLAKDVSSYNLTDQTGFPFNLTAANLQAGDCVVDLDLADNVPQVDQWLFDDGSYEPSDSVQEISWQIINDTGIQ